MVIGIHFTELFRDLLCSHNKKVWTRKTHIGPWRESSGSARPLEILLGGFAGVITAVKKYSTSYFISNLLRAPALTPVTPVCQVRAGTPVFHIAGCREFHPSRNLIAVIVCIPSWGTDRSPGRTLGLSRCLVGIKLYTDGDPGDRLRFPKCHWSHRWTSPVRSPLDLWPSPCVTK